ncbi:unnamed protein product [marine sediment metagenome]|uniref:Uncharacterized protein n=1 Tax=marine sediment metagenome TaxID=412755 RepID=X1MHR4_9ZZZZ
MKRTEILGQVYDAILHRPTNTGARWYLGWVDGKIQCLPMSRQPVPEVIFDTFKTYELNSGFNDREWTELEAKIYTFLKEKGLC